MRPTWLIDTGPLVAFLNRNDRHHTWSKDQLSSIRPPVLTCEAVLTEACHLLRRCPQGPRAVFDLVDRGLLEIAFRLDKEASAIQKLMARYHDLPMALADACLVRMAEVYNESQVLTLDGHFTVYRMHTRRVIPARMPRVAEA